MTKIFFLILTLVIITSCVSQKDVIYFQTDQTDKTALLNEYKTRIKPDDLLFITISSQDVDAVKPFNISAVTYETTSDLAGVAQQQSYLVDSKGEIELPVLGKLKVSGLTREELIALFTSKLKPDYVKDPNINVRIGNFKVSVLGDVSAPGVFNIASERITILEAIALAGDLNVSGKRDNILVLRESDHGKIEYRVNLLSDSIFTSPVYYLQQNDLIYIEPNNASIQSASSNSTTTLFISITGLLVTIATLLLR